MNMPVEQPPIYAVFAGGIDQNAVQKFFGAITAVKNNRPAPPKEIHILIQSTGGAVGDGICLYSFFAALDIPLHLYNNGSVSSIAAVAYLGAKIRKVGAHATFMFHRTTASPQNAHSGTLKSLTETTAIDDRRTEEIIRAHTHFTRAQWKQLDSPTGLWLTAEDAVKTGVATEIAPFSPPPGVPWFNI
jgi:ATP-dependent protease ClpP protease subunit